MFNVKKTEYLFWIFIFLIILLQLSNNEDLTFAVAIIYSVFIVATLWLHVMFTLNNLVKRHLKNSATPKFIIYSLLTSVITAFILTIEGYYIIKLLLPEDVVNSLNNELIPMFFGMLMSSILISGMSYAIELFKQNIESEKRHQELKNSVLEMEIDHLRTQLSPHFTFNILNNLQFLIRKDTDEALELLSRYSKILRYYVYESQNKWIRLEDEIAFLKHYFELEKDRYGEDLQITCKWEIPDNNLMIIPFLLSTFVENAFKHVSLSPNKANYIHLNIFLQNDNELVLIVENTYDTLSASKNEGIGLKYVKKRLELSYHDNHKLDLLPLENVYRAQLELNLYKG